MANIKFTNLASSALQQGITNTSGTLQIGVDDVAKFPTIAGQEYFIIVVVGGDGSFEIMRVTGVVDNTFTVTRAQEGTVAKAFVAGDKVEHRLTAESLVTIVEEASVTKPHTSEDADTYGHATSTVYSHVKITDDPTSSAASVLGIAISPYAVKTRFDQLLGASNQTVITTSSAFVVPETGTYEVTAIAGGGKGGNGGWGGGGSGCPTTNSWALMSGGGAGGGGAGQVITQQIQLNKDTSVQVTVGGSGGNTTFGSYLTAIGGSNGNNGGNATYAQTSAYNAPACGSPGSGGTGGYSYGTVATNGASGTMQDAPYANIAGGAGGTGGVSLDGTYGNGGNGGAGGGVYNPMAGDAQQFLTPGTGSAGTQGCVKIRLVLGS